MRFEIFRCSRRSNHIAIVFSFRPCGVRHLADDDMDQLRPDASRALLWSSMKSDHVRGRKMTKMLRAKETKGLDMTPEMREIEKYSSETESQPPADRSI